MELQLLAVYRQVPEGYIGFVDELPGAKTQGATFEETRAALRGVVELALEANRAVAEEVLNGAEVIRAQITSRQPTGGHR